MGLPFAAYVAVMAIVAPATEAQWALADPILGLWPRAFAIWSVPIGALVAAGWWWRHAKPDRATVIAGLKDAALGVLIAFAGCAFMRWQSGPMLPSFVPPEESAGPGYLLSMSAGFSEEVVCRMALLPLVYFALEGKDKRVQSLVAVVVTGLAFSLWHMAGETEISVRFFVTRFVIPGCGMSIIWLFSPSAIVSAHSTAHLLIPALFQSPV